MVAVVFRGKAAADEHAKLRDSMLKRDADRACEILKKHIDACVVHTLDLGVLS
jgi:DNA-binding GntR family transcriptional regulator